MELDTKPVQTVEAQKQKEEFVADLSYVELQYADWPRFAGMLKRDGVLSNSYDKKPVTVEYSLDKQNSPVVELTFRSKTSDSVRIVLLTTDRAYLFVNGAAETNPETERNKTLNKLWVDYQKSLRYYNYLNTNREEYFHKQKAEHMIKTAERITSSMDQLYKKEQEFLETNKGLRFSDIGWKCIDYAHMVPVFRSLPVEKDGVFTCREYIMPFSPRTLEFCILNMTPSCKAYEGEYIFDFEDKCQKIQEYSCYESEEWDSVIEFGKEIVKNEYIASLATDNIDNDEM
jgi:hypothetical protein